MEFLGGLGFGRMWGSCSFRAVLPEQMSQKIADFAASYFKNFSFSCLKESKWTYIVVGSALLIACLVKISRLYHQLLKKNEEIKEVKTLLDTKTQEYNSLHQSHEGLKISLKEQETRVESLKQDLATALELLDSSADRITILLERESPARPLHSTGRMSPNTSLTGDVIPSTDDL